MMEKIETYIKQVPYTETVNILTEEEAAYFTDLYNKKGYMEPNKKTIEGTWFSVSVGNVVILSGIAKIARKEGENANTQP